MRTIMQVVTMACLTTTALWAAVAVHPLFAVGAAIVCMWELKTWGDRL